MDRIAWEKRIKEAMAENGLDKPQFSLIVETLADILEQRDLIFEEYKKSGGQACIVKTSDRGAKNVAKNPYLSMWLDFNSAAVAYWRECALSPAALRKISVEALSGTDNSTSFDKLIELLFKETEKK